ncbi:radical SAM/SPASM domain-containing protein [Chloroflexota bacterium]
MEGSPRLIDWAITTKCNLSCRHCRGMVGDELSTERARKLITEIAELKPCWVIVEGGEPLLREDLFQLLDLMRQKGLEVHLITNGMLLNPGVLAALKRLGVKVMISIDGAIPQTYEAIRSGASFETVMEKARNCAREGILEAINFTILKSNYTEIPAIFELATSIGVKSLTFIGFKPCHGYHEELLLPEEYEEAVRLTCRGSQETGCDFFFDEPFFWAIVKERGFSVKMPATGAGIVAASTTACIFGEYLFIDTNGDVKPCSYASTVVGNVNEKPLGEVWREVLDSPFFQVIREPESRTGYCRDCHYLTDCKGCRSRTFMLTEDWFASDSCCPLSLKLANKGG